MFRILLIMLSLLATEGQTVFAAAWELPPDVKTKTVNEYPMAYRDVGSGETVVLLHGAGNDYRTWNTLMKSPPSGFRLIAVSRRHYYPERWDGQGGKFSTKQHIEDLTAFIEALGVGPVHLVAHSLGGNFAVRAAQSRPDLVRKLVLMEGAFTSLLPPTKPSEGVVSISAVRKAVIAQFEQGDMDGGLETWVDRDRPGVWKERSEADRQRSRDNAWTLIIPPGTGAAVTCPDLAGLAMPVLLLQGEKTVPRFARIVEETRKCMPSAEHLIISNAGHSMHTMNPAGVQAALFKFLKE